MKITAIKQQQKRGDRYSIFVDGKYAFSLSDRALLEQKLSTGQELTAGQLREYQKISGDDKLYAQALRWASMRLRSRRETEDYLKRKKASPALTEQILNKLSIIGFIDDKRLAEAFVSDRTLLRPTSKRKLRMELRKKKVEGQAIEQAMARLTGETDQAALQKIIAAKRRQAKYQDDLKLMQYLARQGFNYDDIKSAINAALET